MPKASTRSTEHRVVVVLERIQVLTSHDIAGPGEFRFHISVYRPGDLHSRQRRTLPENSFFQLRADESVAINRPIFEGELQEEDNMVVQISGVEHDLVLHDHLKPYFREFRGRVADWAGHYGPGDGEPGLESLEDWKVWYRVEVDGARD